MRAVHSIKAERMTGVSDFRKKILASSEARPLESCVAPERWAGTDPEREEFLTRVVGSEPTPEFAAPVTDEYRRLVGSLTDESSQVVSLLRLEGRSNEGIARSLDCGLGTVERKLEVIRKRWMAEGAS